MTFVLVDQSEAWLADVLANHYEEARSRADFLLAAGLRQDTGCIETETLGAKKTRFRGRAGGSLSLHLLRAEANCCQL